MELQITEKLKQLVSNYKITDEVKNKIAASRLLFLVGAAGAGKNTIQTELIKLGTYLEIVSHTTRKPRKNHGILEQDGVEYNFVTPNQMEALLEAEQMVEAKVLHDSYVSGTSINAITKASESGLIGVTDIDVQGVEEYMSISDKVVPIFFLPPSFDVWVDRLNKRYGDTKDHKKEINKRMQTAKIEIRRALSDGYFHFVINDDIPLTTEIVDKLANGEQIDSEHELKAKTLALEILTKLDAERS